MVIVNVSWKIWIWKNCMDKNNSNGNNVNVINIIQTEFNRRGQRINDGFFYVCNVDNIYTIYLIQKATVNANISLCEQLLLHHEFIQVLILVLVPQLGRAANGMIYSEH